MLRGLTLRRQARALFIKIIIDLISKVLKLAFVILFTCCDSVQERSRALYSLWGIERGSQCQSSSVLTTKLTRFRLCELRVPGSPDADGAFLVA